MASQPQCGTNSGDDGAGVEAGIGILLGRRAVSHEAVGQGEGAEAGGAQQVVGGEVLQHMGGEAQKVKGIRADGKRGG